MKPSYRIIDSDSHVLEPADLWTKYMPANLRDKAPHMRVDPDGQEAFTVQEGNIVKLGAIVPNNAFAAVGGIGMREGNKPQGNRYVDGMPGGFDPVKRLPDMDKEGIDATFLYPSLGLYMGGISDPKIANPVYRAYNRWLHDYCSADRDRLFGVAMLPLQSVEGAIEEIKFVSKELGMKAGFIRPNPYGPRFLHHPDNDPIWRAAEENNLAIAVHAASSNVGMSVLGDDRFGTHTRTAYAVKHATTHTLEMMAAVTSFVMCGICDRFPKLRVGFMEAGGGWVAGWLDRMDRHYDDQSMNDTKLKTRPSDQFKRQCFISFEPVEGTLPLVADYIGRTNILWATDYPHSDGYTDAPGIIRKMNMPPDLEKTIFCEGAKRFYDLKV